MKFSSLLTSLLSVLLVASFEKPISNSYGLTSFDLSWITWEEQAFERSLKKSQKSESFYKEKLKTRIAQQISLYKTGLEKNYINTLSELIVHEGKKYGYDPFLLTAIIINFGLMGLFGIDLTHMTAVLSSIIIGVGFIYQFPLLMDYKLLGIGLAFFIIEVSFFVNAYAVDTTALIPTMSN